jgi:hypothetical protein
LLRSRRLLAEGDPVRPNDPQQILSSIWASPSYYFDSRSGNILEERNWGDEEVQTFRSDDGRENYLVRWRAVLIGPGSGRVEQINEAKAEQRRPKTRGEIDHGEKIRMLLRIYQSPDGSEPDYQTQGEEVVSFRCTSAL